MKNKIALRGGGYALAVTAIVLAIVLAVNYLISALPAAWTKLDMSFTQQYTEEAVPNNSLIAAFYRYDGSSCLCQINGESFALLSRSTVVELMEAVRGIVLN